MLFHVSERPDIAIFQPRPAQDLDASVVWTIDAEHLRNYLVPRDCPRVTYGAGDQTTGADVQRFLGSSKAVVAVEGGWIELLRTVRLYCYHMPPASFECIDAGAGYFVSRVAVVPARVEALEDSITEILQRGVELRLLPNLWSLRDAVVQSSLQFSIIRMRNALPRVD
jgi:hypothetical protein